MENRRQKVRLFVFLYSVHVCFERSHSIPPKYSARIQKKYHQISNVNNFFALIDFIKKTLKFRIEHVVNYINCFSSKAIKRIESEINGKRQKSWQL